MPYPAVNTLFDAALPAGLHHYWKGRFGGLPDDAFDVHVAYGETLPCLQTATLLFPVDGAVHRVDPTATAFAVRDAPFASVYGASWPDAADSTANVAWSRAYDAGAGALRRHGGLCELPLRRRRRPDPGQLPPELRPPARGQDARTTRKTCSGSTRTSPLPASGRPIWQRCRMAATRGHLTNWTVVVPRARRRRPGPELGPGPAGLGGGGGRAVPGRRRARRRAPRRGGRRTGSASRSARWCSPSRSPSSRSR